VRRLEAHLSPQSQTTAQSLAVKFDEILGTK